MSLTGPTTCNVALNADKTYTVTGNCDVWNQFNRDCIDHYNTHGYYDYVSHFTEYGFSTYLVEDKVAVCSTEPITEDRIVPNVKFEIAVCLTLTGFKITLIPDLPVDQSYNIAIVPDHICGLWEAILHHD